jgi:L-rhamnose mutarotase
MRYCLTLDLKNDPEKISEYEAHHKNVWPEIIGSITGSGINSMEIYRFGSRLLMIMDTDENFSFENKAAKDSLNKKVQEWEELMWHYQQPVNGAEKGEKWVMMNKIFDLKDFVL